MLKVVLVQLLVGDAMLKVVTMTNKQSLLKMEHMHLDMQRMLKEEPLQH